MPTNILTFICGPGGIIRGHLIGLTFFIQHCLKLHALRRCSVPTRTFLADAWLLSKEDLFFEEKKKLLRFGPFTPAAPCHTLLLNLHTKCIKTPTLLHLITAPPFHLGGWANCRPELGPCESHSPLPSLSHLLLSTGQTSIRCHSQMAVSRTALPCRAVSPLHVNVPLATPDWKEPEVAEAFPATMMRLFASAPTTCSSHRHTTNYNFGFFLGWACILRRMFMASLVVREHWVGLGLCSCACCLSHSFLTFPLNYFSKMLPDWHRRASAILFAPPTHFFFPASSALARSRSLNRKCRSPASRLLHKASCAFANGSS